MDMWKKLASENGGTLYKRSVGEFNIEVVDEFLTPQVRVSHRDNSKKFELSKVGVYFSDGDNRFYRDEDNSLMPSGEFHDIVIEEFLQNPLSQGDK